MKNFVRTPAFFFLLLTVVMACTKDIGLKTEVEFNLTEQHKAEGYVNEDQPTTLTVVPEEILEEFSYSYSYSISKGDGYFRGDAGEVFPQNENIALNPLSVSIMYVGSKPGRHIVEVIATDNYGFADEIELDYTLAEIPPVVWTATSMVNRIELGNSAHIRVTFEKSAASTGTNYERRYRLVSGSGTLTELTEQAGDELDGFKPILPGSYPLKFTPDQLGIMELFFELKGDDGEEFTAKLGFEVLEEIVDDVAPEIILLGNDPLIVAIGNTYVDPGATASDDVDGEISKNITVDASDVDTSVVGTYQVTYNVIDSAGNQAPEVIRMVEVISGDNPQSAENNILAFALQGQEKTAAIDEMGHTVNIKVPFGTGLNVAPIALTISPEAKVSPSQSEQRNFENPVSYTVTAENGDEQEWVINVTIDEAVDITPPTIVLIGVNPQIIEVGETYVELGATATDDFEGDLTQDIIITSSSVDTNEIGNYLVTYDVKDAAGNPAEQVVRTVKVEDTTLPVITLSGGNTSIAVGESYIEPGYTATDNFDGNITGDVTVDGTINTDLVGTYTLNYNVSDAAGNAAVQKNRTIQVIDNQPPVITLSGGNTSIAVGESYIEPGYSATDNFDGNITGDVTVDGTINMDVVGTYTLNYNVSDAAGNAAVQKNRTIQVIDDQPPIISLLGGNVIMKAGNPFIDPGYSATDNVDGNLTGDVLVAGNLNTNREGIYSVTYNVSDSSGNAADQLVRTVTVYVPVSGINLTPDYVSVLVDTSFQIGATVTPDDASDPSLNWSSSDADIATVNSVGLVIAKSKGTVIITATANDGSGITGTRTVRVVDSEFDRSTGVFRARAGSRISVRFKATTKGISPNGVVSISISESGLNDYTHSWIGEWEDELTQTFTMPASGKVIVGGSHMENANIGTYEVSQTSFDIGIQGETPFTFTFNNQNRLPN